jgi:DNA-binding MarR family transcriptional regulator
MAAPTTTFTANLSWLLSQASHNLSTQLTAALEDVGLLPRSFCVLKAASGEQRTQIELAQAVGLDKTTMVVTVDALEAAGLARRVPSATDRRARIVTVTEAGERKMAEAEEIVDRTHAEVLAELPEGEREAFVAALNRLVGERLSTAAECSHSVRRRREVRVRPR